MLETLRQKMAGTSSPSSSSLSAPPPLSRASSYSSESNVDSTNDVVTPLTASHENDQLLSRFPERSLRQRCTLSLTTTALDHHNNGSETESLTSSEDGSESNDKNDKATSSSLLGSVMGLATHAGASSFLLGPHAFSTSELRPPRSRKESNEFISDDDDDDDASSSPSVMAASSAVSSPYPHLSLEKSPSSKNNSSSLYRRVQLHSSSSLSRGSSFSDVDLESGEQQVDDMVPLMSSSKTFSPRRRQPLNQQQYPLSNNNKTPTIPTPTTNSNYAFNLRSREQVIIHFLMELCMLRTDLLFICFTTFYQFFQSAVTNVAYYQHAQLNAANRIQLKDVAFDLLPPLDGELWIISEYIMIGILGISISCIASNLILSWNAPHGRPIYSMQIIRRMGMTWIVCQTLRMISFLVTTLPGASRHCRYSLPEGLTSEDMISGPAPDEGNPAGWAPPTEPKDILFRLDATNGCGDLMFSSHTIFTMTFVCVVFKYFNFKWLKCIMALLQIIIVPFILAARKHYSVDVFTALYVTPLVFEILWIRFPDRDTSVDLAKHYGIRFYLAQDEEDSFSYVVSFWGREYYVDPEQLPVDLKDHGNCLMKKLSTTWGKGMENSKSIASIV